MDQEKSQYVVIDGGSRVDRFLATRIGDLSRTALQRLILDGFVTVGHRAVKPSYRLQPGDVVEVTTPEKAPAEPAPEPIPLSIIYEDGALLVVDKPAGLVVHPAPGHAGGTLVNALLYHCPELRSSGGDRPGIVHRLDRDTSGLIVVAKNDVVRRNLQRQFQERRVNKVYLALLDGLLRPDWGRVHAPLGRDREHRQRIVVQPGGREAATEYRVTEYFSHQSGPGAGDYSLVRVQPETGRTHQIRVHFAAIRHPVVGDAVYGRRRTTLPLKRQFLHASRLVFEHPLTRQPLELESQLPEDLAAVLELLRSY